MNEKSDNENRPRSSPKSSWHSFGLQQLSADKFKAVVSKIISGRFFLVGPKRSKEEK